MSAVEPHGAAAGEAVAEAPAAGGGGVGPALCFEEALRLLRLVRGDEVSAYSEATVRAFLRQTKQELEEADHYNAKARPAAPPAGADGDATAGNFFFISYAWEPPAAADPRRGTRDGEDPYLPSIEQQAGRPEQHTDAREWYAQAQAKSVYLECRGQRGVHPKDLLFWIERACLPQTGPIFELARRRSFFLLEYILLSRALVAVASPHYFSRGWCLFEFATKLATAPQDDPAALGVAWKAFASFGTRKDGFPPELYADVLQAISIEKAEFSLDEDRAVLLAHVDRLFTSRVGFDRFAKFAALLRLGRSCYTQEDRAPFAAMAKAEGFDGLAAALATEAVFDPRKNPEAVQAFDAAVLPLFAAERASAVRLGMVEEMLSEAARARLAWCGAGASAAEAAEE